MPISDSRMDNVLGTHVTTIYTLQNIIRKRGNGTRIPLAFTLKYLLENGFSREQLIGLDQDKLELIQPRSSEDHPNTGRNLARSPKKK